MADFVYDNGDLPDGKQDGGPVRGSSAKTYSAAEWNRVMQAMKDLRTAIKAVAPSSGALDPDAVRVGVPPYEVSGMAPYDPDHGFPFAPTDHETVIYVASPGLASDPTPKPWGPQGDDVNGDGTKAKPLATVDGVFKRFGRRAAEGERFLVKLAGGITEAEAALNVDPWDGQCSSMRQYPTRGFVVSGGEAYVNSFRWQGPLKGFKVANQPTITDFLHDSVNGRTKWRYSGSAPGKGTLMRITRAGAKVSFEVQIVGHDSDYLYTSFGNYDEGLVFEPTDTFEFICRAAEFIPTSRPGSVDLPAGGGADGIMLQGWGAGAIHGRLGDTDYFSANPAHTFTLLGFENLQMRAAHGVSFDRCTFYHSFDAFDSSIQLRGCGYDGQHPPVFVNCQVNVPGERIRTEDGEFAGHAEVLGAPTGSPAQYVGGDPLYPQVGGVDLYVYNEVAAAGLQLRNCHWCVRKGLTVEGGLLVRGGKFVMFNPSYSVLISNPSGVGLRVTEDGLALLYLNAFATVPGVANDLQVGVGAAIDLGTGSGQFSEAAGWNGNFCRRLEVNAAGKPTGDLSAIRDSATWGYTS